MKRIDYKWQALAILWVAFFLEQGTRQIFNAALPQIQLSFGVTKTQIGVVGTLFSMAYGICVPFAGIAADLLKRKWMITVGTLVFSAGIFLSGFAASIGMLMIAYGLLNGVAQSFFYPSTTSLIGQLHKESRATALSILQMGLYVGIVLCSCVSGWFAGSQADGWRYPFWGFGAFGLVWTLVLLIKLRDTAPVVVEGAEKASFKEAVLAMLSKPSALLLAAALGMHIYVDIGFKTWMPTFLQDSFAGTKPAMAAFHAVVWHYCGAFVGVTIGSRISDRLVKVRRGIRMEINVVGLVLSVPFIVMMAKAPTLLTCCIGLGLFGVFRGIYDSNLLAALFDVIKPRYHASATGLMFCCAFVFGSSASTVLGWIGQHFSLQAGLVSLAGFYAAGAVLIVCARLFFLQRDFES